MNKQIRGNNQGGGIAGLTDLQNPLLAENLSLNPSAPKIEMNPQTQPLPPLRPMAQPSSIDDGMATDTGGIDAKTQILLDLLQPKDYDKQKAMYEERFSSLIPPRQRLNFYDLASELGAAILSRPQDEGVFPGVGVGFGNFQKRMSQADAEERKERQGFAMKAVELAMADEREAEKILKQYAMESLMAQTVTGEPKLVTLTYDEVGDDGQFTGKKLQGSFDKVTQAKIIRKIVTKQNGVVTSDLPDPSGESDLSKEAGKQWIKDQAAIRENAKTAGGTLDMVKEGKVLANKLGPENFGKAEAALLPLKQFVAGFFCRKALSTWALLVLKRRWLKLRLALHWQTLPRQKALFQTGRWISLKRLPPILVKAMSALCLRLICKKRLRGKNCYFLRSISRELMI